MEGHGWSLGWVALGNLVRRDVKSSGIGSGRSLFQVRG